LVIKTLLDIFKCENRNKVFFFTDEGWIEFYLRNRIILESMGYTALLPSIDVIENVVNKAALLQVAKKEGIEIPNSYFIEDEDDIKHLPYPIYLKIHKSWRMFEQFPKGRIITNAHDALRYVHYLVDDLGLSFNDFLFQELLSTNPEDNISLSGIFMDNSDIYAISRKLLQTSSKLGAAIEIVFNDEVKEKLYKSCKKLFKKVGYYGIAECEFIHDKTTGDFKLIEVNPRFWLQHSVFKKVGINFAEIYFLLSLGVNPINLQILNGSNKPIVWINETHVIHKFKSLMLGKPPKDLTVQKAVYILKSIKDYATISIRDPLPGSIKLLKSLWPLVRYLSD
jgi:predicted ATP-grasp superfamily ATP-dependent carboligase